MSLTAPARPGARSASPGTDGPLLVPGTLLITYLLCTGRWGSYLGWPERGVYVTDLGIVATAAWVVVRHRAHIVVTRERLLALLPVAALLVWAGVRFVLSGAVDTTSLRDLAPYAYAVLALTALVRVGPAAWRRTAWVVTGGLVLHLVWVAAVVAWPDVPEQLPLLGGRVHVLELRQDFDGAALGLLAAVCLHAALTASRIVPRLAAGLLALLTVPVVLQLANRAGLLALLAAVVVVLLVDARQLMRVRPAYLAAGAVVVVA
ncbi:hypothetical protein, partial [Motilibacter deserti]